MNIPNCALKPQNVDETPKRQLEQRLSFQYGMESDSCKNSNDIEGQSIYIEWHVFLGDTSVQTLKMLKVFMLGIGHEPESFPDRIKFASMFNNIANWKSPKEQTKCQAQAEEVANNVARFTHGYWCFCLPRSEKT